MTQGVRAGKRSFSQRFFTDPITGILIIIFYGVFWLLPVDVASWAGEKFSRPLSWILHKKHKVALYNLHKCFPDKSDAECKKIARGMWKNLGRIMGELPHMKKMGKTRIEVVGQQYVDQIKNDGKGGFMISGHIGNWELCTSVIVQMGLPLNLVYRMANNPWVEKTIYQRRKGKGLCLIPKGPAGARQMIELLRKGEHIGMLCDQKLREGIDVPFFGFPTKTAPAVASLALRFNLPIFPARAERLHGAHYRCTFFPPLTLPHTGNNQQDVLTVMTQINQMLEQWIKDTPEQWLWIHHRWDKSEYPK